MSYEEEDTCHMLVRWGLPIHMYIHIYIHTHIRTYIYIYIYMYTHSYARARARTHTHTHTHTHCVCVCVCVCVSQNNYDNYNNTCGDEEKILGLEVTVNNEEEDVCHMRRRIHVIPAETKRRFSGLRSR